MFNLHQSKSKKRPSIHLKPSLLETIQVPMDSWELHNIIIVLVEKLVRYVGSWTEGFRTRRKKKEICKSHSVPCTGRSITTKIERSSAGSYLPSLALLWWCRKRRKQHRRPKIWWHRGSMTRIRSWSCLFNLSQKLSSMSTWMDHSILINYGFICRRILNCCNVFLWKRNYPGLNLENHLCKSGKKFDLCNKAPSLCSLKLHATSDSPEKRSKIVTHI